MSKLYNIGAYGIPPEVQLAVVQWRIDRLRWSNHAKQEATKLIRNGLVPVQYFPASFYAHDDRWTVVEAEVDELGHPVKIVARREALPCWSLVLVITVEGVVKTCWANLNTDNHRTLDISKFSKP